MTHNEQNIETHHEGDHVELHITVTDENGNIKDLTGAEATWVLQEDELSDETELEKTGVEGENDDIEFSDPENGELIVEIQTGQTEGLVNWDEYPDTSKQFHHRIRVTDAEGRRVTGFTGTFEVIP